MESPQPLEITSRSQSRKEGILLLILGVVLIGVSALMFYRHHQPMALMQDGGPNSLPIFGVTIAPVAIAPMYRASEDPKKLLTVLQLPDASGTVLPVLDLIEHNDSSADYILLTNAKIPVSQVFTKGADGKVVQRTTSQTMKFSLASDHTTGALAFLTVPAAEALKPEGLQKATAVLLTSEKEKVIGPARQVAVLEGGKAVVIAAGKSFTLVDENGSTKTLLTTPVESLSAIDVSSKSIALVNYVTQSVDTFTFTSSGSASYVRSIPLSTPIHAIAYKDGYPLIAYVTRSATSTQFTFEMAGTQLRRVLTLPADFAYVPSRLSITHD